MTESLSLKIGAAEPGARPSGWQRRLPYGAELVAGGAHVRVWAPKRRRVELVLEDGVPSTPLEDEGDGHFAGFIPGLTAGALYQFRLDDEERLFPDPHSRFQPAGPHGPSQLIDPAAFPWTDSGWLGASLPGQVIYELHIGTFTPEGTWASAVTKLPMLRDLGVTTIEVMPIADFPGAFGWGYDGVNLYAPVHLAGRPDDLRRFVDAAHALGLAVILDVVYNHFGPDGNHLESFSEHYFARKDTEWGRALNYDGDRAGPVRELIAGNAAYWIDEYHFDGLRLDATQSIFDSSAEHVIAELTRRARAAAAASGRSIIVVAENEPQDSDLVRPPVQGGCGLDGMWNDDFHHTAVVAATGRREAYYTDYLGSAQEFVSAAKHGFLYQGQRYDWQKGRRGRPTRGIAPWRFVCCLENHDQVANSLCGERLWQRASPGQHRALTTALLLGPWTPMLFQGQEWNSSRPFLYFADHKPDLASLVANGRAEFLRQFPSCATKAAQTQLGDPGAAERFASCRLRWDERTMPDHTAALRLHEDLLRLRREDPILRAYVRGELPFDGAVLSPDCFLLRVFSPETDGQQFDDRLLVVNLGRELRLSPAPEPLLAPPAACAWRLMFASENVRYGGAGAPSPESEESGCTIAAHAAVLLAPQAVTHVEG